jgi:hypothetical protein
MNGFPTITAPKLHIDLLDQIFEIEKKLNNINEPNPMVRNITRMKEIFEHMHSDGGLIYQNPLGEEYSENRLDLEASIAGESTDDLIVIEVIKPIIRWRTNNGGTVIVRKGVVTVESKNNNKQ